MSIKISNVRIYGWEAAIRGMRNPMNSWDRSDSEFEESGEGHIGSNDLALMQKLVKAGPDHAKFLRMIGVSMDIEAPLYWLKEWETYKIGTVSNSCSTMHKIHAKEFTIDDFSHEHLIQPNKDTLPFIIENTNGESVVHNCTATDVLTLTIDMLNIYRQKFLASKDKKYWWQMIQLLPSSYNQLRTVTLNYAVLLNMYKSRKNHKLDEWKEFCDMIETLPYFLPICKGGLE